MPQVVDICPLTPLEKKIYQTLAKYTKQDVFVYDGKGCEVKKIDEKAIGSAYHIYLNAVSPGYYRGRSLDTNGRPITPSATVKPGDNWDIGGGLRLPAGTLIWYDSYSPSRPYMPINYLDRVIAIPFDFLSLDELDRVVVHCAVIRPFIGDRVNIPMSSGDKIDVGLMNKIANASADQRKKHIADEQRKYQDIIRDYEAKMADAYRGAAKISREEVKCQPMSHTEKVIKDVLAHPDVSEIQAELTNGAFQIAIITKQLIVSLPGGDLPSPPLKISINTQTLGVTVKPLILTNVVHVHNRSSGVVCWGGFESMIFNSIISFDLPALMSVIIAWVSTYNPSSRLNDLLTYAAQMSIDIGSESQYLLESKEEVINLVEDEPNEQEEETERS